jgi:hypothetical protein
MRRTGHAAWYTVYSLSSSLGTGMPDVVDKW